MGKPNRRTAKGQKGIPVRKKCIAVYLLLSRIQRKCGFKIQDDIGKRTTAELRPTFFRSGNGIRPISHNLRSDYTPFLIDVVITPSRMLGKLHQVGVSGLNAIANRRDTPAYQLAVRSFDSATSEIHIDGAILSQSSRLRAPAVTVPFFHRPLRKVHISERRLHWIEN